MITHPYRILNFFLLLFALNIGASVAGASAESSDCAEAVGVVDCCVKMACCKDEAVTHTVEAESEEAGCSHNGFCATDGLLPAAANDRCIVDSTNFNCLVLLSPDFAQNILLAADPPPMLLVKLVQEKSPPLYIQNCSFLS